MPSARADKIRVNVGGVSVDPAVYVRVGGVAVRIDPDPVSPPTGGELAIPAGGVTASGIPSTGRFGQAADFYDSFGVNTHWKPNGAYGNPTTNVQDVAALGMRHIRDTMTGSWWSTVYPYYRAANVVMRNRNAALPAPSSTDGGQPIFQSIHTPGFTGHYRSDFGNDFPFTVDDWYDMWDAGRAHWQPVLSPRTQVPNGTTSNPNATVPNPWNHNDPEMDWSIVGLMTSVNEPDLSSISNLKPWTKEMRDEIKTRTTTNAFGGLPVVTTAGIRSGVKVSQIPLVGPSLINNGVSAQAGDMSLGTNVCDLGDNHPYQPGNEPSHEKVTSDLQQTGLSFNGMLASPPSLSKSLPFIFTEYGHITRGFNTGYPGAHSGYWPSPDDVIAEYAIRSFTLFYWRGIRRTYWYEIYDTLNEANNPENNFGLLTSSRVKKAQFWSIRNLLSIVGFTEAPQAQKGAIPYSLSGFVPQGAKYNPAANAVQANGSGFNQHYAMYGTVGQTYEQSADRLDSLLLQQSADTYLLILMRQVMLWDREPGNWNLTTNQPQALANVAGGRFTPNSQNITVTFPQGISSAQVATPTAGGTSTPESGRTFSSLTITGGTQVTVPIQGNLKAIKVTAA